jgi:Holliday junction resolvase RusA-like endonuclease
VKAISFRVFGEPKAQPRPRAFARKFGNTYSARVYDAGTAEGWKGLIAQEVRPLLPAVPIDCPVRLDAVFLFDRPKRLLRKSDPAGRLLHTSKPDRDNLEKALLDCLTQVGVLADDCHVCAGEVRKYYVAKGERPGVIVRLAAAETFDPYDIGCPVALFAQGVGAR